MPLGAHRHEKAMHVMLAWICFRYVDRWWDKTYGWAKAKDLAMAKGLPLVTVKILTCFHFHP